MSWSGSKGRSKTLRVILRQLKSAKSSRLIELLDSRLKIAINYFFFHCDREFALFAGRTSDQSLWGFIGWIS